LEIERFETAKGGQREWREGRAFSQHHQKFSFNEYDSHQRKKLGEVFVELDKDGFITRDVTINRSTGFEISNRGSYYPLSRIKKGTGHERVTTNHRKLDQR
jgi:Ca2+-binding EF-hand superfamily protein